MTENEKIRMVLGAAKALISTPETWTQKTSEITPIGGVTARCSVAAIYTASKEFNSGMDPNIYPQTLLAFRAANGDQDTIAWNDTDGRTHREVMKAFKRAIASVA